jgi:hypothetical protein
MSDLITLGLLLAIVPFSFSLLIDLCLGKPAAVDFDKKAIFFFVSYNLAKLRLLKNGTFKTLLSGFKQGLDNEDPAIRNTTRMTLKNVVFESGREFFSWELGVGMCPYCTNVRVSIFSAIAYVEYYSGNWLLVILIPCFSNMFLLFFNKLKF